MENLTAEQIVTQYQGGRRDFSGVNAKGVEITSKNLSGIIFRNADLSTGSLRECNLAGADFTGANMKWMDLDRAKLKNAVLNRADLSYSKLIDAIFENTKVSEANFSYALMFGVNNGGANFGDAITENAAWKKSDVTAVSSIEVEQEAEKTSMSLHVFMGIKKTLNSFGKTLHDIGSKIGGFLGYSESSKETAYGSESDKYSSSKGAYGGETAYGSKSAYTGATSYGMHEQKEHIGVIDKKEKKKDIYI